MTPARRIAITVALVLAAFIGGTLTGRATREPVVEYRTLDLKTEDITRGYTFAKTVTVTRWRNVVTTITDAGTTISDQTIEREGGTESSQSTEQLKRVEYVEREKVVTLRPDWRIGALGGVRFGDGAFTAVAGGLVERRVLDWASVAGVGLIEIDPKTKNVTGGSFMLGVTGEF